MSSSQATGDCESATERVEARQSASITDRDMDEAEVPRDEKDWDWVMLPASLCLGAIVGLAVPASKLKHSTPFWDKLSATVGWMYFFAWTVSFYPQILLVLRRRSIIGMSFEYQLLNLMGFGCYSLFNAFLFWSPHIQDEYRERHGADSSIPVQVNDVFFSVHAVAATSVTIILALIFWDYPPLEPSAKAIQRTVLLGLLVVLVAVVGLALVVMVSSEGVMTWLTFLGVVSQVKVGITVIKYCPQVWMNYTRKSTVGWNIYGVLLDFTGGALSIAQLMMDATLEHDPGMVFGDPAKLLLGNISILFDLVFGVQHYVLYRHRPGTRSTVGLLSAESG